MQECHNQLVSFEIIDITDPSLFQIMPTIANTDLGFRILALLSGEPSGLTTITSRAIDNGAMFNRNGQKSSFPVSTTLKFRTKNEPPSFIFSKRFIIFYQDVVAQFTGTDSSCVWSTEYGVAGSDKHSLTRNASGVLVE
jgi:hypothetical protein